MAQAGGLSAQFGMVDETTFGTAVTVTRFLEFNNETMKQTIARIESGGLRPTRRMRRSNQWLPGRVSCAGDVELEVQTNGFGLLFKHMLGAAAAPTQPNAGSNPTVYEQVFKVGALDGKSFTLQLAAGDTSGTVRAFTYAGCKIDKWELMCDENGFLKTKVGVDAISESTAVGLASASYAAGTVPLVYTGAVIKLGGAEVPVKKFTLAANNQLALARYFMRGTTPTSKKEQLEDMIRPVTGTLDCEFESLSLYEKYVKAEEFTLEANFVGTVISGTYKYGLKVDLAGIRFDGAGPDVKGEGLIDITFPFTALETGSAATGVQFTYTTTDASN